MGMSAFLCHQSPVPGEERVRVSLLYVKGAFEGSMSRVQKAGSGVPKDAKAKPKSFALEKQTKAKSQADEKESDLLLFFLGRITAVTVPGPLTIRPPGNSKK